LQSITTIGVPLAESPLRGPMHLGTAERLERIVVDGKSAAWAVAGVSADATSAEPASAVNKPRDMFSSYESVV
jgi:hypothetical protein